MSAFVVIFTDFQIKTEKRDEAGPSLDGVDVAPRDQLWSNMGVIEREERLQDFTAASVISNEQTECRGDTECDNWSFDWQPQPGSSRQVMDTDDEEYNPAADSDHPFLEFTGKKASMKSGKAGNDIESKIKHECPVCRKKLGRKQELKRHMLLHTGEKPFSCPVCDKRFIQKSNLKSHIVTHLDSVDTIIRFQKPMEASRGEMEGDEWGSGEGELGSDPQNKLTDNLSDSDDDEDWAQMMEPSASGSSQQMQTGDDDPDGSSLERISLLLHQALNESKARGKPTEFQCPMCDKIFGRMENLRRHLLVHTGEKAFSCPVCNKQFTLKQHLKLHMVLHTRDQQFACAVCSKTFIRKDNLRSHMRIHSTDRPFGCSECGARFYTDQDLARHMAHHTGARPFVCPICNSGFLSRRYLNRHIKIHKREDEKAEMLAGVREDKILVD